LAKASKPPHEAIQKHLVFACEIMYAKLEQVIIMLMGIFGQAVLGLCKRACHVNSARCKTAVVANSMRFWPQDEHQNYVCNQFAEARCAAEQICGRAEAVGTLRCRCVSRTVDFRILKQESHRQTKR
jgi:hypothetical protein